MSRAGSTARSEFGFEPPTPSARVDQALDDRGLPQSGDIRIPGWRRFAGRICIRLNGQEVKRCVAFDVEKGVVTRQRLDAAGRIYVDPVTDKVAVEQLTGTVWVTWR